MVNVAYGLAVENVTPAGRAPDIDDLITYAVRAEQLGFRSLWAWDHLFLGAENPVPCFEALTTLTTLAAHTTTVTLGTGALVLPIRDPAVLAKTAATLNTVSGGRLCLGLGAGWYEREFAMAGSRFRRRDTLFDRNLELCFRQWEEDQVVGELSELMFRRVSPPAKPRPRVLIGGYTDRVLRRAATGSDGWLAYFCPPEAFAKSWRKLRNFAGEAGRDPNELTNVAQLPLCVDTSFEQADRALGEWLAEHFDSPQWNNGAPECAIRGTPEQCADQLFSHIAAGARHIALVPYRYRLDQTEAFAQLVRPLLGAITAGAAGHLI